MNPDHRSTPDTTDPQEPFDAETLQAFERSERMISAGTPKEKRQERRAAWRSTPTDEKLWLFGHVIVWILSTCGIDVVCDFFHLPGIFFLVLWSIVCLTLGTSKFYKS